MLDQGSATATPEPSQPASPSSRERTNDDKAPRRAASTGAKRRLATRLAVLAGTAVLVMMVATAALLVQLNTVARQYDDILASQVREAMTARKMQVEFKKQVQEWKDILLRGFDPKDMATYTTKFRSEDATVNEMAESLIQGATDPARRAQFVQFRDAHDQLDAGYEASLAAFVASDGRDFHTSDRMVRGKDRPPTDLLDTIVRDIEQTVSSRIAAQKSAVAWRERIIVGAGLLLLLAIGVAVFVVVRGVVRPIRRLTGAAYEAANETLPRTIARIKTMPADAEPPALPAVRIPTRDELQELGEAFTSMQASAVGLALEQHRADREAADMLINLGRRNQSLLSRTLSYITDLERTEQDPDALGKLFRLDHATTRIRRNAESMLVLAGATHTRTWSRPLPVGDVVRAALSEIEEYARVDLHHLDEVAISGSVAADVVHLLAELIENATHFSPPSTRVTIVGQHLADGYRIRVIDTGIGMTGGELEETNRRLRIAQESRADTALLGLHVVGLLATRRGIRVSLEPSAGRGITANVILPRSILSRPADREEPGGYAHPAEPYAAAPGQFGGQPTAERGAAPEVAPWAGGAGSAPFAQPTPAGGPGQLPAATPWQPAAPAAAAGRSESGSRAGSAERPDLGRRALAPTGHDVVGPIEAHGREQESRGTAHDGAERRGGGWAGTAAQRMRSWADPGGGERDAAAAPARTAAQNGGPSPHWADVPRRIRGAQLPDLGPTAESGSDAGSRDAAKVRGQLQAFQAGVEAGRSAAVPNGGAQPVDDNGEVRSGNGVPSHPDVPGRLRPVPPRQRGAGQPAAVQRPVEGREPLPDSANWDLTSFLKEVDAARRKINGATAAQSRRGDDDPWRREDS